MVKLYVDGDIRNLLSLHELHFLINSPDLFNIHNLIDCIIHTMTFGRPAMGHWLEQKKMVSGPNKEAQSCDPSMPNKHSIN